MNSCSSFNSNALPEASIMHNLHLSHTSFPRATFLVSVGVSVWFGCFLYEEVVRHGRRPKHLWQWLPPPLCSPCPVVTTPPTGDHFHAITANLKFQKVFSRLKHVGPTSRAIDSTLRHAPNLGKDQIKMTMSYVVAYTNILGFCALFFMEATDFKT